MKCIAHLFNGSNLDTRINEEIIKFFPNAKIGKAIRGNYNNSHLKEIAINENYTFNFWEHEAAWCFGHLSIDIEIRKCGNLVLGCGFLTTKNPDYENNVIRKIEEFTKSFHFLTNIDNEDN